MSNVSNKVNWDNYSREQLIELIHHWHSKYDEEAKLHSISNMMVVSYQNSLKQANELIERLKKQSNEKN